MITKFLGWSLLLLGWSLFLGKQLFAAAAGLYIPLVAEFVLGGVLVLMFLGGVTLIIRVKKMRATSAEDLMAMDDRPPILYLRSFNDDGPEADIEGLYAQGLIFPKGYPLSSSAVNM